MTLVLDADGDPVDGVLDVAGAKSANELLAASIVRKHLERVAAQDALLEASGTRSYLPTGEPAHPAPARSSRPPEVSGKVVEAPRPDHEAIKADFKVFLTLVWRHLGLPDPTPIQLSMADYLQHGPRSAVIMAFRGAAKSWITAAFALWNLYCNPQFKVMVVSGSMKRAVAFTTFCLTLIRDMPLLAFLEPSSKQRQSSTLFDVGPARPDQSASLSAFGITGQIVGQRADLIVGDDVETNTNSLTVMMREKLGEAIKEFDAILKPGGRIKFLGTPQTNDSIYNKLPARGYTVRIWPILFPDAKRIARYGDKLSPWIRNRAAGHEGQSVEPTRFGREEIERQMLSLGTGSFDLQYMLDTSLADASRYPLKLANLIVMSLQIDKGPNDVTWGRSDDTALNHLPTMGFPGDRFYKPQSVSTTFSPWNSVKAMIDTSGEGEDETALSIGAELHGRVFGLWTQGWLDGASPQTIREVAVLLVKYRVNECTIETNYGGSMFGQLLKPILQQEWDKWNKANPNLFGGTLLIEERAQRLQKELRIIADLEPATQSHRVVVTQEMIEFDYQDVTSRKDEQGETFGNYSLWRQYCNLTRDRNSLTHDDRLETFAGMIGLYREVLGVNPQALARRHDEDEIERELEELDNQEDEAVGRGSAGNKDPRSHRHAPQNTRVR